MPHITLVEDEQGAVPVQMIARTALKEPSGGGALAVARPRARHKAATVSGPRRWNSASSLASRATKSASDSVALLVMGEGRRHVAEGGRQQRRVGPRARRFACRQRAQRIATVALATAMKAGVAAPLSIKYCSLMLLDRFRPLTK
jgi:hypothetical protein